MRESINNTSFSGQTYGVTEDVRAYRMEILNADGDVAATCEYMPMSARVLAASMAHWSKCHAENGTHVRLREIGPHFQRSQFGTFEVRIMQRMIADKQAEARKVWDQYIGWKTVCTTAAAGEGLVG